MGTVAATQRMREQWRAEPLRVKGGEPQPSADASTGQVYAEWSVDAECRFAPMDASGGERREIRSPFSSIRIPPRPLPRDGRGARQSPYVRASSVSAPAARHTFAAVGPVSPTVSTYFTGSPWRSSSSETLMHELRWK